MVTQRPVPRCAFTLIELLVVMAVIAVMIAMLFPVVSMILNSTHVTACLSNLKQYGMAFATYSNDNRGLIPGGYMRGAGRSGKTENFYGFLEGTELQVWSKAYHCPVSNVQEENLEVLRTPGASVSINGATYTLSDGWSNYAVSYEEAWHTSSYRMNRDLDRRSLQENAGVKYWAVGNQNRPFLDEFHNKLATDHSGEVVLLTEVQTLNSSDSKISGGPEFWWHGWDSASDITKRVQWDEDTPPTFWGTNYVSNAVRATHRRKASMLFFDLHVKAHNPVVDISPNGMNATPNGYTGQF